MLEKVMTEMFTDDMIEDIADSVMALQKRENTAIPLLKQQLAEVENGIENMLNAMQAGVLTKSTKKRLDDLEAQKEKSEIDIMREQLQEEVLTRDKIVFWLRKMKDLDLAQDDNKRILIDTFVNSIYVHEDRAVINMNCCDEEEIIPFDVERGSFLSRFREPNRTDPNTFVNDRVFGFVVYY